MSRDEALTAVLNAARVVRSSVGPGAALPADLRPAFRQLAAAVEAVDAVGDAEPQPAGRVSVCPICECLNPPGAVECITCTAVLAVARAQDGWAPLPTTEPLAPRIVPDRDRPGLCQADPDCWRYADVGSTCYHHSPTAQKPHPWEQARLRDGVFAVTDDEEKLA